MEVSVKKFPNACDVPFDYQTKGAAGLDLLAAFSREKEEYFPRFITNPRLNEDLDLYTQRGDSLYLPYHHGVMVPTGIGIQLPPGYQAEVRGRSGLASKHGIHVMQDGTIDEDYRGQIRVMLFNHGSRGFFIKRGMRIAQLVITPVVRAKLNWVEELEPTERGEGGFGSTGME